MNYNEKKYSRGHWLGALFSRAIVNLDCAEQGREHSMAAVEGIREMLGEHLMRTETQGYLDYFLENATRDALGWDVFPKMFIFNKAEDKPDKEKYKRYNLADYCAYLRLVLDEFDKLGEGDKVRTRFARDFLIELSNNRLTRLCQ